MSSSCREPNAFLILHSSDCSLRFPQNITFEPNTETKTIKEFYAHYLKRSDKALVLSEHKKLAKGTSLALEVFINEAAVSTISFAHADCFLMLNFKYNARINEGLDGDEDDLFGAVTTGGKRKYKKSLGSQVPNKRLRSGPFLSCWMYFV